MFLKINNLDLGHTTIIECDNLFFQEILNSGFKPIMVDVEKNNVTTTYQIDPKKDDFFIMNDDGKTIEAFKWGTSFRNQQKD